MDQGGGGVEILLVTSCYKNWDKRQPDGRLGLYADLLIITRRCTIAWDLIFFTLMSKILISSSNSVTYSTMYMF